MSQTKQVWIEYKVLFDNMTRHARVIDLPFYQKASQEVSTNATDNSLVIFSKKKKKNVQE